MYVVVSPKGTVTFDYRLAGRRKPLTQASTTSSK